MNNLQDQGRACYKRGDYKKAIEHFDRAIGRSPSVQLLDNRAACYEKLHDYSTALKDAKKAIQLHREDAVGYLRAGRVLTKMGKPSVALEIYTHGLKCIKHVGQGYEQLRKVHKEFMDQLCPPKSVDPMTVLPRELAETILEYLSFRQRMNACLVSKQWTQFIRSIPALWRHLDLTGARKKVRTAFISRAINTARGRLKSATLNKLWDFDKTLHALVKHCQLEELILLECGLQGANLITSLARAKTLRSLSIRSGSSLHLSELNSLMSKIADKLETLECFTDKLGGARAPVLYHAPCHMLKYLNITLWRECSGFWRNVPEQLPALQTLIISGYDYSNDDVSTINLEACAQLRHLEIIMPAKTFSGLRLPSELTTFALTCRHAHAIPALELPALEKFSFDGRATFAEIHQMLNNGSLTVTDESKGTSEIVQPSKLSSLSIKADATTVDAQNLFGHPRLKDLVHLGLALSSGIDDTVVAALAHNKMHRLRSLDLAGTDVTGVGVKDLVSSLKLETLKLIDCRNISPDAVEWARSKGVAVTYRMTNNSDSGRKVRY